MAILIPFINYPFAEGDTINFGFENQNAVDEFGTLFLIPSMSDTIRCILPEKQELPDIMKIIKSPEHKNILTTYASREILLNPDDGEFRTDVSKLPQFWNKG